MNSSKVLSAVKIFAVLHASAAELLHTFEVQSDFRFEFKRRSLTNGGELDEVTAALIRIRENAHQPLLGQYAHRSGGNRVRHLDASGQLTDREAGIHCETDKDAAPRRTYAIAQNSPRDKHCPENQLHQRSSRPLILAHAAAGDAFCARASMRSWSASLAAM